MIVEIGLMHDDEHVEIHHERFCMWFMFWQPAVSSITILAVSHLFYSQLF